MMKISMPIKLTTVAAIMLLFVGIASGSEFLICIGAITLTMLSCTFEILEAIHDKD